MQIEYIVMYLLCKIYSCGKCCKGRRIFTGKESSVGCWDKIVIGDHRGGICKEEMLSFRPWKQQQQALSLASTAFQGKVPYFFLTCTISRSFMQFINNGLYDDNETYKCTFRK